MSDVIELDEETPDQRNSSHGWRRAAFRDCISLINDMDDRQCAAARPLLQAILTQVGQV